MKLKTLSAIAAVTLGSSFMAQAVEVEVGITNLTQGVFFTPRLVVAHTADADLFEVGEDASMALT
ncbi:hypothetical protein [Glaciecola sp. 1036]|uniref:hypothetical protein n=1 Tax=Alteromonadaceae TaxID=72275 RepID=UPI003D035B2D